MHKKLHKRLEFYGKCLTLRMPSLPHGMDGGATYFCACVDGGIQGVKSGSFFPVMLKRCLCECAPCSSVTSHR